MKKILIKRIGNWDNYNEATLEKSNVFLNNLQDFLVNIGLVKIEPRVYEFDGKPYDVDTYYTLFYEDPKKNFELRRLGINEFDDGRVVRYHNKNIEMLIIFLEKKIKLIFYCNLRYRKKVIKSLMKFCKIKKNYKST